MQTKNACEDYLNSREVIRIVQSDNATFIGKVLECIRGNKAAICQGIALRHPKIPADLLLLIRDDAFQQAQLILLEEIRHHRFAPATRTCIPFLKTVFRNEYYREYKKELLRKERLENGNHPSSEEMKHPFPDELSVRVAGLLEQLSPADREIYRMKYKEDLKTAEIAPLLQIAAESVTQRLIRLHRRFSSLWNK